MGAFYNSICIPGDHRSEIRQTLDSWLSVKGFSRRSDPPLFDLDGDNERSAFLVSDGRWTLLFYSHWDEETRLIRELRSRLAPVLYMWVYDSEVWGYDLLSSDDFAGSFASDSRTHQSFFEVPMDSPRRPRLDAAALAERLELPDKAAELQRIVHLKTPFKEEVCKQFCRALGMEAAAVSYDDLETGAIHQLDGWQSEQLLFVRRGFEAVSDADLHEHSLTRHQTQVGLVARETVELSIDVLREMKRRQRRLRLFFRLLRPVFWLARAWRRMKEALDRTRDEAPPTEEARPNFLVESAVLKNERHRCRITLAEGARPEMTSKKPASVFAFELRGVTVTCTARRRRNMEEVLRKPNWSKLVVDEKYHVGGLKARHLIFELPPRTVAGSKGPTYMTLYVIQTDAALYVFLHRTNAPLAEDLARAIRSTVDTFRLLEE